MAERWILAIDFGTTNTSAAIATRDRTEVVEIDGGARIPSTVFLDDHGNLTVGASAEAQLPLAPERAERTPKRRIGDPVILLGDRPIKPVEAVAAVLRTISTEAIRRRGGAPPDELRLTHPARWGTLRLNVLAEAARLAGLPEPLFVPEPVAAAVYFADERIDAGSFVAVYDLGGGTFDTAVVSRTADGFVLAGPPGGNERLGGEVFDEILVAHLGERLSETNPAAWESLRFDSGRTWRKAAHDFRTEVRRAKEAVSSQPDYSIYLGAPVDAELLLTRDELEHLIRPQIESTVRELLRTIERAGVAPGDLAAVNIVGGSSRIPLVTRLVAEQVGRVPDTWGDPKGAVALGAAKAEATSLHAVFAPSPGSESTRSVPETPAPDDAIGPVALDAAAPDDDSIDVDAIDATEAETLGEPGFEPEPSVDPIIEPDVADVADRPARRGVAVLAGAVALIVLFVASALALTRDTDDADADRLTALDGSTSTTRRSSSGSTSTTAATDQAVGAATTTTAAAQPVDGGGGTTGPGASTSTTARQTTNTTRNNGSAATTTSTTTKEQVIAARSVPAGLSAEQQRVARLIKNDALRQLCRGGPGWNSDYAGFTSAIQCHSSDTSPSFVLYVESYDSAANADAAMMRFNTLDGEAQGAPAGCSRTAFHFEGTYATADGGNPDGLLRCMLDGTTSEMYWTDRSQRILGWVWWYSADYASLYALWESGEFGFDL